MVSTIDGPAFPAGSRVLRASGLVGRGPAPRPKGLSFAPPSAEAILNATKQLRLKSSATSSPPSSSPPRRAAGASPG